MGRVTGCTTRAGFALLAVTSVTHAKSAFAQQPELLVPAVLVAAVGATPRGILRWNKVMRSVSHNSEAGMRSLFAQPTTLREYRPRKTVRYG